MQVENAHLWKCHVFWLKDPITLQPTAAALLDQMTRLTTTREHHVSETHITWSYLLIWDNNEEHVVTLSDLLLYPTESAGNNAAHIIVSRKLKSERWPGKMYLQFSPNRTSYIRSSKLYDLLLRQFSAVTASRLDVIPKRLNIKFP
jgi:hypothetical protein